MIRTLLEKVRAGLKVSSAVCRVIAGPIESLYPNILGSRHSMTRHDPLRRFTSRDVKSSETRTQESNCGGTTSRSENASQFPSKWSHFAAGFRNDSGRVSQLIFVMPAEGASALPFRGPWHGAGWVPKPCHDTCPEGVLKPSENVPSEPCRNPVRTVPGFDHGILSKSCPTTPLVTALEAPQSPAGGLPKRRRYAVTTSGLVSFQIPFPTPFHSG